MRKRLWIAALAVLSLAGVSQAATVVYTNDFSVATNLVEAGMAVSAGAAGGTWAIDTVNNQLDGVGGGNARSHVFTSDSWQSTDGFTLEVTFYGSAALARHSFGIVDADYTPAASADWLNQARAGAYGIGYSSAGEHGDQLAFNDGSTVSNLSSAVNTSAAAETMSITVTADSWSYSLNGATAVTNIVPFTFDTSKSYRFIGFAQRNSRANFSDITLTALTDPVAPYEGTVWELDMNTDPVLTNWTVRSEGDDNYTLTNGVMTMTNSTLLDSTPYNELKGLTKVDLEWRSITEGTGSGKGAFLWLNIDGDLPTYNTVVFDSVLTGTEQEVHIFDGTSIAATHAGFSDSMLTLSATIDAFNETAEYVVTDGAYSVTNTVSLTARTGGGARPITLGTKGPTAEVDYVRVEANVRPDEAILVAEGAIAMELIDPATTATGSVELAYGTVSTNLEITAIVVSDESHNGAFSVLTAAPQTLDSAAYGTTNLVVEFDNDEAGLLFGSATGLVTVSWTETGSGVTSDTVVPVSVNYSPAALDVTWDGGGNGVNWGDAANWDPAYVPGASFTGGGVIGNGGSVTVATNYTGNFAYGVTVSNSSTLNVAADLQNAGTLTVGANSVLNVDNGSLAGAVILTIADGAVVSQTGGSVEVGSGLGSTYALDISSNGVFEISGGTFRNNARTRVKAGGIFRIIGDGANVSQNQLNGSAGTFEFVLNETGVSTLVGTSWAKMASCTLSVDGSAYTGGSGDIMLYSGISNGVNSTFGSYSVSGLGTEGDDWTITESLTPIYTVTLNILGNVPIGDITMGGVNEDGDLVFSWDTVDGQAYNVMTNADLVYPNWGVSDGPIVGDGSPITVTNTPVGPQLFYKVTSD